MRKAKHKTKYITFRCVTAYSILLFDLEELIQSVLSTSVMHLHNIPFTYKDLELQVLINDYPPASPITLITHLYQLIHIKAFD